ncbi:MAG: ATP synthase F0 subunit A [Planctomycetaceae bacterium]|nr:MAG: ATP synthase F0 subunit A [Planctomycetaceae bacterium]
MAAGHADDVFHHVRDATVFELPKFLGGELHIPQPFSPYFSITKFMILEVVALVLALVIFRGLAKRVQSGEPLKGRFWNFWESILLFLRDEVVRPNIGDDHAHGHDHHEPETAAHSADLSHSTGHGHAAGHAHDTSHAPGAPALAGAGAHGGVTAFSVGHPADKYLPYIWSVFFFILFCNLLGAIPWLGSPTGNLWVTGVLALFTLATVLRTGTQAMGFMGFWKSLMPAMDLPFPLDLAMKPLMWIIEFIGLIIKHGVLAVRLFANVMAGHTVIAVILGFIAQVAGSGLFYVVAPASVLGQVGIGLLELFVAFLQAYVFAYLSTLFIAAARHPH